MNTTNNGQMTIKCPACKYQFDPSQGVDLYVKEASRLAGLEQGKLLARQEASEKQTDTELENIRLQGLLQDRTNSERIAVANAALQARTEEQCGNCSTQVDYLQPANWNGGTQTQGSTGISAIAGSSLAAYCGGSPEEGV